MKHVKTFRNNGPDFQLEITVGSSQVQLFLPHKGIFKVSVSDNESVEFKAAGASSSSGQQYELEEVKS